MILYLGFGAIVVLSILLYPMLLVPNVSRKRQLQPFQTHFFAHRGLHDNAGDFPENTLAAFQKAAEEGFGIELDLQLTKDKQVVAIHDYDLKRAVGAELKVSDLTYGQLREYRLFDSQQQVPLFREVLDAVAGRVPLIIEIKAGYSYKELCKSICALLEEYPGLYCVESFHPLVVMWFRKYHPRVIRGQLSSNFAKEHLKVNRLAQFILTNLLLNFMSKPDFIAYNYLYKRNISLKLCKNLYKVKTAAWTIKSQKQLEDNRKDFDIFIFDSFLPTSCRKTA